VIYTQKIRQINIFSKVFKNHLYLFKCKKEIGVKKRHFAKKGAKWRKMTKKK
jgi:hypothetical protein